MSAVRFFKSVKETNAQEIERLNNDIQEGIIKNIKQQLKDDDTNFTGDLSESFKAGVEGIYHTVETKNPYSGFIEFGMPAGRTVSFSALRIWVEGKLGIPEGEELDAITWKILNAIKANGIQPRRYMKKSIKKFIGKYGKHSVSRKRGKQKGLLARIGKRMKKILKTLKKAHRTFKKINRKINSATKPIKKGYKRETKGYTR